MPVTSHFKWVSVWWVFPKLHTCKSTRLRKGLKWQPIYGSNIHAYCTCMYSYVCSLPWASLPSPANFERSLGECSQSNEALRTIREHKNLYYMVALREALSGLMLCNDSWAFYQCSCFKFKSTSCCLPLWQYVGKSVKNLWIVMNLPCALPIIPLPPPP